MKKISGFIFILFFSQNLFSQQLLLTNKKADFEPIEQFLQLADSLQAGKPPTSSLWQKYFDIPVIGLFRPSFDSSVFVANMKLIFSPQKSENLNTVAVDDEQKLMIEYKENETLIKRTILELKRQNIDDSIKKILFAYLPVNLRDDSILPKQIYMFLNEGTGFPGYVFNSMLQTAKVNDYKSGIISAHESYHSIAGKIFFGKINLDAYKMLSGGEQTFISFMELIAEEGIADLIDKPILSKPISPLYEEVLELRKDQDNYARYYIEKIDSLLTAAYKSKSVFNFQMKGFSKNMGHIPGRFMALKIKESGLLPDYINYIGDPFKFFELYNDAVKKVGSSPAFSEESILFLNELKNKAFKKSI